MSTARNPSELRHDHRYPVKLVVTLLRQRGDLQLTASDVSFRGLFIEADDFAPVRQLVRLRITLPNTGEDFLVHAMVVHQVPNGDPKGRRAGVGVQLYAMDQEARATWGGLVLHVSELQRATAVPKLRLLGSVAEGRRPSRRPASGVLGRQQ